MCIRLKLQNLIRMGSPDVPIRIRRGIVQIHVGRVTIRAVVAVAADKGAKRARPHRAHTISLLFHFSVICSYVPGEFSPAPPAQLTLRKAVHKKGKPRRPNTHPPRNCSDSRRTRHKPRRRCSCRRQGRLPQSSGLSSNMHTDMCCLMRPLFSGTCPTLSCTGLSGSR